MSLEEEGLVMTRSQIVITGLALSVAANIVTGYLLIDRSAMIDDLTSEVEHQRGMIHVLKWVAGLPPQKRLRAVLERAATRELPGEVVKARAKVIEVGGVQLEFRGDSLVSIGQ